MLLLSSPAMAPCPRRLPFNTPGTLKSARSFNLPIACPVSPNFRNFRFWVRPRWVYVETPAGQWEEPAYDSGSESDEGEEVEDGVRDDWTAYSDGEDKRNVPAGSAKTGGTANAGYENLVKGFYAPARNCLEHADLEAVEAASKLVHMEAIRTFMQKLYEVEVLLAPEEKDILLQNDGPVLSKISTKKWAPLQSLALSGQIPFMDKLLEHGLHIDSVDKDGLTALHKAVIGKKEAVISHLLRKGASPHVRDNDGATPLHYAVQVGAMQTVKLLIKYKVDVNVADDEGWTPLHVAIQSRCRDIAKVLLVNGADKTRRTKDGKTPLDLCLCYGKDFKSYDLAKLVKQVPANRDPWPDA